MSNKPIIAYDNQLVTGRTTYTFTAGADGTGSPLSGALLQKNPQISILRADANGTIQIEFDTPPDYPYGQGPHGIGYLGGFGSPQALLFGAHRHDPARQRFADGNVQLEYMDVSGWVTLLPAENILANVDQVSLHLLDYHTPDLVNDASYKYRLTITGLAANADVVLPYLFLGPVLTMPYMELGFDPNQEATGGTSFKGGSGAVYENTVWRKKKSHPAWHLTISNDKADEIYLFQEHLELKRHYYFFWAPQTRPFEGYLMRHAGKEIKQPMGAGMWRSWTLPQEEVV
jgi:hypothetical protein